MKLLRTTKMKIASIVIGVLACIYAVLEGLLFGFLIALFVGIGEGLGGSASWITSNTLTYLGLGCIFFALVDLIAVIFTGKRPLIGGILFCLATAYITAFGVIFCIFANGQVGAIFLGLGGTSLHLASSILAFMAAKNHTTTARDGNTINMVGSSVEAGAPPINDVTIPIVPTTTIQNDAPFDSTDSLTALNALKGSATLSDNESAPPDEALVSGDEQKMD